MTGVVSDSRRAAMPPTHHFVVIAEFEVKEGRLDAFLAHAQEDARQSLACEPGCLQFDVLRTASHPRGVVFYEVYASSQAFEDHLETPHVERFRSILADHVEAERPVRRLERLSPGQVAGTMS